VEFATKAGGGNAVYTQLKKHRIIFCGISYPGLPADVIVTAPILYYRFHVFQSYIIQVTGQHHLKKLPTFFTAAWTKNIFLLF
jgi:hypothetical protein